MRTYGSHVLDLGVARARTRSGRARIESTEGREEGALLPKPVPVRARRRHRNRALDFHDFVGI